MKTVKLNKNGVIILITRSGKHYAGIVYNINEESKPIYYSLLDQDADFNGCFDSLNDLKSKIEPLVGNLPIFFLSAVSNDYDYGNKALDYDILEAHEHSRDHLDEIQRSTHCHCFYCLEVFHKDKIVEYVGKNNSCALCPECGIDSVIGDSSGVNLSQDFIKRMREYWFDIKCE